MQRVCYTRPGREQNEERKGGVHVLGEYVSGQVQSLTLKSVAFEEQQRKPLCSGHSE